MLLQAELFYYSCDNVCLEFPRVYNFSSAYAFAALIIFLWSKYEDGNSFHDVFAIFFSFCTTSGFILYHIWIYRIACSQCFTVLQMCVYTPVITQKRFVAFSICWYSWQIQQTRQINKFAWLVYNQSSLLSHCRCVNSALPLHAVLFFPQYGSNRLQFSHLFLAARSS